MRIAHIRFTSFVVLACAAMAWAAEPVAYVTEIHRKAPGDVSVRTAGEREWKPAQPLMPLGIGDEVRAAPGADAVLLLRAGGTQRVTAADSPLSVKAPPEARGSEQTRAALTSVAEFFVGKHAPPTYRKAAVRGVAPPPAVSPEIVFPRETRLFPGPVAFVWRGSDKVAYTVRVLDGPRVLWEQANARPMQLPYAGTPLQPGVRYVWELEAPAQPVQRAQFEILPDSDALRVRNGLAALSLVTQQGYSRGTVALMRAAVLFEDGLYAGAQRELEDAIARDGQEPTLHLVLGHVYDRMGLIGRAGESFERARGVAP